MIRKKRGISNDQICIETGIDRKGNIVMEQFVMVELQLMISLDFLMEK